MKIKMKRFLGILLSLALAFSLMPVMSLTAYADVAKAYAAYDVTSDANKSKSGDDLTALQVTFNGYNWYIIEDNSSSATTGTVTMLAGDTSFGAASFSTNSSNVYSNSIVKGKLDALTESEGVFSDVANVIQDTSNGKLYLLSKEEAEKLPENVRKFNSYWWLRSPGNASNDAAYVDGSGNINSSGRYVGYQNYLRPALVLNMESVIFSSVNLSGGENTAASGGSSIINTFFPNGSVPEMTTVTYTANEGYKFPESSDYYKTINGITVERTGDAVVTVSGTPIGVANVTIPDAEEITTCSVTYKVVGGTWSDDSTTDKTENVQIGLQPTNVPIGMKPSEGYTGGAWDVDPANATITEAKTFTYSFIAKQAPSIILDTTTLNLTPEESQTITATVVPSDAIITWKTDDEAVATVDSAGKVTGVADGSTKIKATISVDSTDYTAECVVTVTSDISSGKTNIDQEGSADEKASIEITKEQARTIVADKADVSETDTVDLILRTDNKEEDSLSDEEKDAADAIKAKADADGLTIGSFVDITLFYEVTDANGTQKSREQLSETSAPLTVKFPIPSGLQKSGRLFSILRYHSSVAELLGQGSGDSVDVQTDKFSLYAIAYEDDAATEEAQESEKKVVRPHTHTYAWDVVAATEDADGELRYQCTECYHILTRVPLSAYYVFNANTVDKINKAKQGETVKITTDRWISFHKMVFDALAARPDVSLEVSFLDGEYKGNRVSFTIPAGADTSDLFTEDNFAGFMYLGNKYGITAEEN